MLIGKFKVKTFNDEIITTDILYDGEDFYFIDKNNDIIEVYESIDQNYDYTICGGE